MKRNVQRVLVLAGVVATVLALSAPAHADVVIRYGYDTGSGGSIPVVPPPVDIDGDLLPDITFEPSTTPFARVDIDNLPKTTGSGWFIRKPFVSVGYEARAGKLVIDARIEDLPGRIG